MNTIFEVQGQRLNGHWVSLYQYRDPLMAKAVVAAILDMDEFTLATHKDGLGEFEDFRVANPAQAPATRPSEAREKPQEARTRRSRPQAHQRRVKRS